MFRKFQLLINGSYQVQPSTALLMAEESPSCISQGTYRDLERVCGQNNRNPHSLPRI